MALERDFETYNGGPTVAAQVRIHVTLGRGGRLYFNENAFRDLGRPQAVTLHFSREKDMIAVSPSNPNLAISFPVLPLRNGYRVNAAPFCRHFGIDLRTTERFSEPQLDSDGIIRLSLKRMISVTRRRPKKR